MRYYKLLSSEQIKYWDKETMRIQQISSEELMERAGINLYESLIKKFKKKLAKSPVYVFCGVGNNGGDGLVISRLLILAGYDVKTVIVPFSKKFSGDFQSNLKKLENLNADIKFFEKKMILPSSSFVIDAIFGTGLNRPAEGIARESIDFINKIRKKKLVSIDIPSGMYVDKPNEAGDSIVKSDLVLSIELPKRSFYFPENIPYIRKIKLVSIGLEKKVLKKLKTDYYTYKIKLKKDLPRPDNSYKYQFGHACIIAGSYGMFGAGLLASKAALRAGAGLVTAVMPAKAMIPLLDFAPEIMMKPAGKKYINSIPLLPSSITATGIGPGLGLKEETAKSLLDLIEESKQSLILDADALNILSKNKSYFKKLPSKSVLTPHEGELKRLLDKNQWHNTLEKILSARKTAHKYNLIFVLKGPYTVITNGKKIFFNPYANGALAKAGTGDVLTGIITGVQAQLQKPFKSALIGVQMHSKSAAKFNNKKFNKSGLLASDLIENLKKMK